MVNEMGPLNPPVTLLQCDISTKVKVLDFRIQNSLLVLNHRILAISQTIITNYQTLKNFK